jgi:ATP-dependent DNA ligase
MRHLVFNILKYQGKDVSKLPYPERLQLIQTVLKKLPKSFESVQATADPEQQRQLWQQITSGKHPQTSEGIVAQPVAGGVPSKVKPRPEFDVVIKEVFQGQGRNQKRAGGFHYALPQAPDKLVGKVGSGFTDEDLQDMWSNREAWEGRQARVNAQEQFESGALRAPAFISRHEG